MVDQRQRATTDLEQRSRRDHSQRGAHEFRGVEPLPAICIVSYEHRCTVRSHLHTGPDTIVEPVLFTDLGVDAPNRRVELRHPHVGVSEATTLCDVSLLKESHGLPQRDQ